MGHYFNTSNLPLHTFTLVNFLDVKVSTMTEMIYQNLTNTVLHFAQHKPFHCLTINTSIVSV